MERAYPESRDPRMAQTCQKRLEVGNGAQRPLTAGMLYASLHGRIYGVSLDPVLRAKPGRGGEGFSRRNPGCEAAIAAGAFDAAEHGLNGACHFMISPTPPALCSLTGLSLVSLAWRPSLDVDDPTRPLELDVPARPGRQLPAFRIALAAALDLLCGYRLAPHVVVDLHAQPR